MPDYFAHEVFGKMVLERLRAPLRDRIEQEKLAYFCGQYGPDPMFFLPGPARDEARRMHRQPCAVPAGRLARAVRAGVPETAGYLAGFLCHYLLDTTCHPYILQQAAEQPLNHTAIETEFDRFLLTRFGYRTNHDTPMVPAHLPPAVRQAAAEAYVVADAVHYQRAYRSFTMVCRTLARLQGTPARPALAALSRLPGLAPVRGCVSGREPDPAAEPTSRGLLALLEGAAPDAAAHIGAFFDALAHGGEPERDAVWQRDFFGNPATP